MSSIYNFEDEESKYLVFPYNGPMSAPRTWGEVVQAAKGLVSRNSAVALFKKIGVLSQSDKGELVWNKHSSQKQPPIMPGDRVEITVQTGPLRGPGRHPSFYRQGKKFNVVLTEVEYKISGAYRLEWGSLMYQFVTCNLNKNPCAKINPIPDLGEGVSRRHVFQPGDKLLITPYSDGQFLIPGKKTHAKHDEPFEVVLKEVRHYPSDEQTLVWDNDLALFSPSCEYFYHIRTAGETTNNHSHIFRPGDRVSIDNKFETEVVSVVRKDDGSCWIRWNMGETHYHPTTNPVVSLVRPSE